jgi:signal transduction histidine kinase
LSRINHYNRLLIGVVLAGAMMFAGLGYFSQRRSVEGFKALSNDHTLWHVSSLEREVFRVIRAIDYSMIGRVELAVEAESPAHRFDILWSRVVTAQSGYIGARLARIDTDGTVQFLADLLREIESQMVDFDASATAANAAVLVRLGDAQLRLTHLATLSDRAEQRWSEEIQRGMASSANFTKFTGLFSVFLSGLIFLAMRWQARLDASRVQEITNQARRAETAAKTRERFLTMVSHELRTPMNGVLGMMALMKASHLDDAVKPFVHHALRSANIMFMVVEALLSMSEIRDGKLVLDIRKFSLDELVHAIDSRLAQLRIAGEEAVPIAINGDRDSLCTGDRERIAQVVTGLVFHMVDALKSRPCSCTIEAAQDALRIKIAFEFSETLRSCVEAVLNPEVTNTRALASDAVGPALARELLGLMGASLALAQVGGAWELQFTIPGLGQSDNANVVALPDPHISGLARNPGWQAETISSAGKRRA